MSVCEKRKRNRECEWERKRQYAWEKKESVHKKKGRKNLQNEKESVHKKGRGSLRVYKKERGRVCVCVWEREREREQERVFMSVLNIADVKHS